jgi:hypothetical protein
MQPSFQDFILECTQAKAITGQEEIQALWSGYGKILKLTLAGGKYPSVIAKWTQGQSPRAHPKGWQGTIGHQRKLKSYRVENHWYQHYASRSAARLPQCYGYTRQPASTLLVLEDLDAAGFAIRQERINLKQMKPCISWLARLHATFMGVKPDGLWEQGTYWHLATRPQEWAALQDPTLKEAAAAIDAKLRQQPYPTLVHGDAKLANFCFAADGLVAGLDFQYVGGGCGMQDLAYFVGSCLSGEDCARHEAEIIDYYFAALAKALGDKAAAVEKAWRPLYRVAWADFHRFLKGWSPEHWKLSKYSERITQAVIQNL